MFQNIQLARFTNDPDDKEIRARVFNKTSQIRQYQELVTTNNLNLSQFSSLKNTTVELRDMLLDELQQVTQQSDQKHESLKMVAVGKRIPDPKFQQIRSQNIQVPDIIKKLNMKERTRSPNQTGRPKMHQGSAFKYNSQQRKVENTMNSNQTFTGAIRGIRAPGQKPKLQQKTKILVQDLEAIVPSNSQDSAKFNHLDSVKIQELESFRASQEYLQKSVTDGDLFNQIPRMLEDRGSLYKAPVISQDHFVGTTPIVTTIQQVGSPIYSSWAKAKQNISKDLQGIQSDFTLVNVNEETSSKQISSFIKHVNYDLKPEDLGDFSEIQSRLQSGLSSQNSQKRAKKVDTTKIIVNNDPLIAASSRSQPNHDIQSALDIGSQAQFTEREVGKEEVGRQNIDLDVKPDTHNKQLFQCLVCASKFINLHSELCASYNFQPHRVTQSIKVNKKGQCVVGYFNILENRDPSTIDRKTSIHTDRLQSQLDVRSPDNSQLTIHQMIQQERLKEIRQEAAEIYEDQCCCCYAQLISQQKTLSVEAKNTAQIIQILTSKIEKVPTGRLKGKKLAKTSTFAKIAKPFAPNQDYKTQRNKLQKEKTKLKSQSSGSNLPQSPQQSPNLNSQKIQQFEYDSDPYSQDQDGLFTNLDRFVHDHVIEIKPGHRKKRNQSYLGQDLTKNLKHVQRLNRLIERGRNALLSPASNGSNSSQDQDLGVTTVHINQTPFFERTQTQNMLQTQLSIKEQQQERVKSNQCSRRTKTQQWMKKSKPQMFYKSLSQGTNDEEQANVNTQINLCMQITKAQQKQSPSPRIGRKHHPVMINGSNHVLQYIDKPKDEEMVTMQITNRQSNNQGQEASPKFYSPGHFKNMRDLRKLSIEIKKNGKDGGMIEDAMTVQGLLIEKELSYLQNAETSLRSRASINSQNSPGGKRNQQATENNSRRKSYFGDRKKKFSKNTSALNDPKSKPSSKLEISESNSQHQDVHKSQALNQTKNMEKNQQSEIQSPLSALIHHNDSADSEVELEELPEAAIHEDINKENGTQIMTGLTSIKLMSSRNAQDFQKQMQEAILQDHNQSQASAVFHHISQAVEQTPKENNISSILSKQPPIVHKDKLFCNVYPNSIPRTVPPSNAKIIGIEVDRDLRSREQFIKDNFIRKNNQSSLEGEKGRRSAVNSVRDKQYASLGNVHVHEVNQDLTQQKQVRMVIPVNNSQSHTPDLIIHPPKRIEESSNKGILFVDYAQQQPFNQVLKSHIAPSTRPQTQSNQQRTISDIMVPNVVTLNKVMPSIKPINFTETYKNNSTIRLRNDYNGSDNNLKNVQKTQRISKNSVSSMTVDDIITMQNQVGNVGIISDVKTQWIEDGLTNMASQEQMTFGQSERSKRKQQSNRSFATEGKFTKLKGIMSGQPFFDMLNQQNQQSTKYKEKIGTIRVQEALMHQLPDKQEIIDPLISQNIKKSSLEPTQAEFFSQRNNSSKNLKNFERLSGLIQSFNKPTQRNKREKTQIFNELKNNTENEQSLAQMFGFFDKRSKSNQRDNYRNKSKMFNEKTRRRDMFTVSKHAVNSNNKHVIQQLFGDLHQLTEEEDYIPLFKQNCLVEYIIEEWAKTIRNQLKEYDKFCKYSSCIKVQLTRVITSKSPEQSECYSVILYGKQTPISVCCGQLICFQFMKQTQSIDLHCLEPNCRFNPLERRMIKPEILETIFSKKKQAIAQKPQEGSTKFQNACKPVSLLQSTQQSFKPTNESREQFISKADSYIQDCEITAIYTPTSHLQPQTTNSLHTQEQSVAKNIIHDQLVKHKVIHVSMLLKKPTNSLATGIQGTKQVYHPRNNLQQFTKSKSSKQV